MYATIVKFSAGLAFLLAILASQSMGQTQLKGSGWTASTNVGPALATDGTNAYIAWVDSATSDIYFATYTGTGWINAQTVSGTSGGKKWTAMSDTTPAWGSDGTNFYLFWKGKSSNEEIWFSEYSGSAWSLQAVVQGSDPSWTAETDVAPAATFEDWPVTLYWKGKGSNNEIWTSTLNFSSPGWTQQLVNGGPTTNVAFGVEAAPNTTGVAPLFVKSASSNDIFAWLDATSFPVSGTGWKAETTQAPAAALDLNGNDIVFWTGQTGTSIFYSYNESLPLVFLGAPVWSEQKTVSGAKTNAAPTVAEANGPHIVVALLAWKNSSDTSIWYLDVSTLP